LNHRPASLLVLLGGFSAAGCGHGAPVLDAATSGGGGGTSCSSIASSSSSGAGGSVVPIPGAVVGTIVNRYFTATTVIDKAVDLSAGPVEAYAWQGGAWETFPGTGKASGSFEIPGVPDGLLMVNVLGSYVHTTARVLDLGTEVQGRPDAVQAGPNDMFAGVVQNVAPFPQEPYQVGIANTNAGGGGYLQGTVTGSTFTCPSGMGEYVGGLVDASKGDLLQLIEWRQGPAPYAITTIDRFATLEGVEQAHGVSEITATLGPVQPNESTKIDFRGSEFLAQLALVGTQTQGSGPFSFAYLGTAPGACDTDWFFDTWTLLGTYGEPSGDAMLGEVSYPNPFPASWGRQLLAGASLTVDDDAGGAVAFVAVTLPLALASSVPIRPLVSPVQTPLVNGHDAFVAATGVSLTPTLSWSAPAVGVPSAYILTTTDFTAGTIGNRIVTTTTSLPLPPGILQTGHSYSLCVRAVVWSIDASTTPFRTSLPRGVADMCTAVMQP